MRSLCTFSPNAADEMEQPLLAAGERLEADGRPEEARVLLLLSVATTFWLNLDKPMLRSADRNWNAPPRRRGAPVIPSERDATIASQ